MSKIYVDEVVSKSGVTKVTFPEGLKVSPTKSLDLDGASINLSTGLGVAGQVLSSTGTGLAWVNRDDTDTTYTFTAQGLALNDVRLNLTAGGSGSGNQQVVFAGTGATNISYNPNSNVITVSSTDNNTTYSVSAVDGTAGKKIIRLTGSDSATDDVTLVAGSNVSLSRTGDEITINSSYVDTNTTYSLDGSSVLSNVVNLELNAGGSGSGTDTVKFVGSGLTTISWDENEQKVIVNTVATDLNTTYSVSAVDGTAGKKVIRLTGSDAVTDDVTLVAGTNVTLDRTGDEITINSSYVDTDTTYALSSVADVDTNPIVRLTSSSGVTNDIKFIAGTNTSLSTVNNQITINTVDTNTTYTLAVADGGNNLPILRLTSSSGLPSDVSFIGENNIFVSKFGPFIKISGATYSITSESVIDQTNFVNLKVASINTTSLVQINTTDDITIQSVAGSGITIGRSLPVRISVSGTTTSIAPDAQEFITISGYDCYTLLKIESSDSAWVRVYTDSTERTTDQNRAYGSPSLTTALITEVITSGTTPVFTPNTIGFDNLNTQNIYLTVTNKSVTTQPISVNLTVLKLE